MTKNDDDDDDGGLFGWMRQWDGCLAGGFSFDELFCGDLGTVLDGGGRRDAGGGSGGTNDVGTTTSSSSSSTIAAVGDVSKRRTASGNRASSYAIEVNRAGGRIAVIFGGACDDDGIGEGARDFVPVSDMAVVDVTDPLSSYNDDDGTAATTTKYDDHHNRIRVGVDASIYERLLGTGKVGRGGHHEDPNSKYTEIIDVVNRILGDMPAHERYGLYVTGHGVGGALATLFGFFHAMSASPSSSSSSSRVLLPVTVVSVASPRVGDLAFARAFAELESRGRIRHLRMVNDGDIVPLGPILSTERARALASEDVSPATYASMMVDGECDVGGGGEGAGVYYDTGIKMRLSNDAAAATASGRRCRLSYAGSSVIARDDVPVAFDRVDLAEMQRTTVHSSGRQFASRHYGASYSDGLASAESELRGLTLNTLYREKAHGVLHR
jgi:hypothetical protein